MLEELLTEFKNLIKENNVQVERINDGLSLSFKKTVLFIKYSLKANIVAEEESFFIEYDTNTPELKTSEFELEIIEYLKSL